MDGQTDKWKSGQTVRGKDRLRGDDHKRQVDGWTDRQR